MILRITVGLHTVLLWAGLGVVMILIVKFHFDLPVWSQPPVTPKRPLHLRPSDIDVHATPGLGGPQHKLGGMLPMRPRLTPAMHVFWRSLPGFQGWHPVPRWVQWRMSACGGNKQGLSRPPSFHHGLQYRLQFMNAQHHIQPDRSGICQNRIALLRDRLEVGQHALDTRLHVLGGGNQVHGHPWGTAHHDRPPEKADALKPPETLWSPAVDSASRYLTSDRNAAEMSAAAIASSSLPRCPTMLTPKSFKSSAVRFGRTVSSISFSRNAASYLSRPRLRSQPSMAVDGCENPDKSGGGCRVAAEASEPAGLLAGGAGCRRINCRCSSPII